MTQAKAYGEKTEECAYLLIQPDPRCPECVAIMDWRLTHPWIAITNGAEIKLSDKPWGSRHLHMRDVRVAHSNTRQATTSRGEPFFHC